MKSESTPHFPADASSDVSKLSGVSELESALADDPNSPSRRKLDRVFCAQQNVKLTIRMQGDMRSHRAELLDISSIGAAVALTKPLTAERTAFLSISWGEHRIKDVVCTISNCLQTSKTNALLTGYRCGISFRPSSSLQLDQQDTVERLTALSDALVEAGCERGPERRDRVGPGRAPSHAGASTSPSDSTPLPQDQPAA